MHLDIDTGMLRLVRQMAFGTWALLTRWTLGCEWALDGVH